uniref:RNA-directed RNA polymerase n=1 Tax=Wuhan insect virus 30 TaxID=1923734 RepID=A0A1L3KFH5_9VIRU|nr:hypothetical protein [Wuhan insect virus 30]
MTKFPRTSFTLGELIEPPANYKGKGNRRPKVRSGEIALRNYVNAHKRFLGTSKAGEDYELKRFNSMARYELLREKRRNLFAFVLPAGHGKTTLAHKYGWIDVDYLIDQDEHEYFLELRLQIMAGLNTWSNHNSEWYARMNKTLDLVDYSRPVILLVHHEETALELGALVMGTVVLAEEEFANNISRRDKVSKDFSTLSRQGVLDMRHKFTNFHFVRSNQDLERILLDTLNANQLPVACPYKYSMRFENPHYTRDVPKWVLNGQVEPKNINVAIIKGLYDKGKVPKECVDYFVREAGLKTAYDFGPSIFDWVKVLSKIPPKMNLPSDDDLTGDLLKLFPARSPKELSRANITMRRLVETFDIFSHDELLHICKCQVGAPQVFVASIISHWIGLGVYTPVAQFILPWYTIHHKHWTGLMKDLHSLIRTSKFFMNTEISESDRQALMYMDLLIGRAEYIINELAVVKEREAETYYTNHLSYDPYRDMYTNEQYRKDFKIAVKKAYSRINYTPKKINLKHFFDFYERRKTWLTKGSLVYNKIDRRKKDYETQMLDIIAETVHTISDRHNKQSFFEVYELMDAIGDLREEDFNVTKTMIKYEVGGKERVLLPGSFVHFMLFVFVLHIAEKQEQVGSVRLNAMADDDIRYFDKKMFKGIHHMLYDWADFNEQHSAEEMALVISELDNAILGRPRDYSMFVAAIAESMFNMYLEDRDKKRHKIMRGLYSGWRGTTWINTVLNFCYVAVALEVYERLYGVSGVLMVDHGGDDIDLMFSDGIDAQRFLRIMDSMLFNANEWKQMIGERSEFFRNTINGRVAYASPTRALASFVAGDWEGAGRAKVVERVTSLLDQIGKLERRGVSREFCNGAAMCAVSHWTKVKDGEEWLSLPKEIIHGRLEDNGLGVPDQHGEVWVLQKKVPDLDDDWVRKIVPGSKASTDYVERLSIELSEFALEIQRREELADKYAEDAFSFEERADHLKWQKLLNFRTEIVGKEKVIAPKHNEQLFGLFTEYETDLADGAKFMSVGKVSELEGFLTRNDRVLTRAEIIEIVSNGEVKEEALDFKGNLYYRRLVPEFIALRITTFCRELLNREIATPDGAEDIFETLCYMSKECYGHMM